MKPEPTVVAQYSIDLTPESVHILYHLILRQCSLEDYNARSTQHTDLGALFVASFFEQADSETKSLHFHCIIKLPCCKKTYEDRFRAKYTERNLQVIKQIKPLTLDPTHLENTLLYVAKDGHKVADDGSINWVDYMRKRQAPKKSSSSKPTFNEFLVDEFKKELDENAELYQPIKPNYPEYEPYLVESRTIRWLKKYFTGKYRDFDEQILIRKYHFLNSMFSLGGIDVVDLAINKLTR